MLTAICSHCHKLRNFSDYGFGIPTLPTVKGCEFVGRVIEGASVDAPGNAKVGDLVGVPALCIGYQADLRGSWLCRRTIETVVRLHFSSTPSPGGTMSAKSRQW